MITLHLEIVGNSPLDIHEQALDLARQFFGHREESAYSIEIGDVSADRQLAGHVNAWRANVVVRPSADRCL